MGGRTEFFGPVVQEVNEPVFHEPWEARTFGTAVSVLPFLGRNIDAFRFAMERLPRDVYLSGYYRRWLAGLELRLVEAGYLGADEVDAALAGRAVSGGGRRVPVLRRKLTSRAMGMLLRPGLPGWLPRWLAGRVLPRLLGAARSAPQPQRFSVGERVRVRGTRADGHTRQPAYVTAKPGVVVGYLGCHVFPDAHAVGRRAQPQHLYTVAFDGEDLWGAAAEPETEARVDMYESYLEAI